MPDLTPEQAQEVLNRLNSQKANFLTRVAEQRNVLLAIKAELDAKRQQSQTPPSGET